MRGPGCSAPIRRRVRGLQNCRLIRLLATDYRLLAAKISSVIPIWAYLAVTVPLVLTPGASTAVVLRNSIAGGTRAGVQTAIGINAGSCFYGCLTAFGVALLLQRWPGVWSALRA